MSSTTASSEETNDRYSGGVELYDDNDVLYVNNETFCSYMYKVHDAVLCDNCNEFVELVRHQQTVIRKSTGYGLAPSLLLYWTIIDGALRCAEALLSGAAGVSVDVDAPRTIHDLLPIQEALYNLLPEFVELCIKYGARFDDKCDNEGSPYYLMQPIEVALQSLREKITPLWLPTQPVYDLIFTFCGSMETKQAIICISHLLRKLPVEQTQGAICHYAREGSIVDLTVLLYVDAISDLGIFKGIKKDEYIALCEYVASNTLSSVKGRSFFMIDSNGVAIVTMNKHVMKSLVLLLKIFYHTDFSLLGFDTVPGILIKRMNNAGFHLTMQENLGYVHEATEVVKCIKPVVDLSRSVCAKALKPTRREYVQLRRVFARNFHGKHSMPSSPHKSEAPWSFKPISMNFKPIPMPTLHGSMDDDRGMVMKATREWPQGNAGSRVYAVSDLQWSPIHLAVTEFLPDFVELFIQHGAYFDVDSRCMIPHSDYYDKRPLNAAVERLSKKIFWTTAESVYGLIFSFSGNMDLAFRAISHVMSVLKIKQIREAIYHYAREGQIIEVAILLFVDAISAFGILKNLSYDAWI